MIRLIACGFALMIGDSDAQAGPIHASVSFPQETQLTTAGMTQPYVASVIVADLNNDGLPDVIAGSQLPGMVAWYQNMGNGTFGARRVISTGLTISGLFASDVDGDGLVDIAFSAYLDNTVAWCKNLGGSTPNFTVNTVSTVANSALSVAVTNVNAEGGPDVLSTSANPDNKVAWYRNLSAGNFGVPTANQNVISTSGISPSSIKVRTTRISSARYRFRWTVSNWK